MAEQEKKTQQPDLLSPEQVYDFARQAQSFLSRNDIYRTFLWKKFLEAAVSEEGTFDVKQLRESYQSVLGFLTSLQNDVILDRQRQEEQKGVEENGN